MAESPKYARVVAILFAVCLIYVLSIGPVVGVLVWLHVEQDGTVGTCAGVFFAPIIYLHDHTLLKRPLELYVESFENLARKYR